MEKSPMFLAVTVLVGTLLLVIFGISSIPPINAPLPGEDTNSATATPLERPTVDFGNPSLGPRDAKVTIVEFGDFLCAACVAFDGTLKTLIKDFPGQVRLVWKDFPFTGTGSPAYRAAIAARCAGYQNAFWEYHDLLFANQASINETSYPIFATQLGLDQNEFTQCLTDQTPQPIVDRDLEEGQRLRIDGTPYSFVNGRRVSGALDYDLLRNVVASELAAAQAAAVQQPVETGPVNGAAPAPAASGQPAK